MIGRRVGVPEYQITTAVWVTRYFATRLWGFRRKNKMVYRWRRTAGREDKSNLTWPTAIDIQPIGPDKHYRHVRGRGDRCHDLGPHPSPFVRRSPKVQRLIPNFREVEEDYFRRTKIFPIMHTVALREEVYEKHPWVAQSLFKAFSESKRICQEAMYEFSALKYMMAWSIDEMEKEREVLGNDPWAYGLEANRHILETLVQYAHEQGLIKKRLELSSLFAGSTLEEFKI